MSDVLAGLGLIVAAAGAAGTILLPASRSRSLAMFAALVLVNTFVALFAGFMPVPGGMGVSEAALTAGLVALGVPNTAAMSTAIAYRLVTFYLPPIWGSVATRWLKQHEYL